MTNIVHLAVFDTLADWEMGYAVANINTPMWHDGDYEVVTVGETGAPVTTMGGIRIEPSMTLADVDPRVSEMLILPGGPLWDTGGNRAFVDKAGSFLEAAVPVAAICGATFGLATAGLLDSCEHTSSAIEYLQQSNNYRGSRLYRNEAAITDGDLITAGPTHPVDFAHHIFARLGLMTGDVLEGWFGLFGTGDPRYFHALMAARQRAAQR